MLLVLVVNRERLRVEGWLVKNFKINVDGLELSVDNNQLQGQFQGSNIAGNNAAGGAQSAKLIPAQHMLHLTLSEGKFAGAISDDDASDRMNDRWPFGESWLEGAYKTFKQRELLEDAALIHRVQRAPSRTVWYIDTGKARGDRATWMANNFKNELNQKRIPQFTGAGGSGESSGFRIQSNISTGRLLHSNF